MDYVLNVKKEIEIIQNKMVINKEKCQEILVLVLAFIGIIAFLYGIKIIVN